MRVPAAPRVARRSGPARRWPGAGLADTIGLRWAAPGDARDGLELLTRIIDFFLHVDRHLGDVIAEYGTATYGILAAVIFAETGFVVTPFLPGDSLLFAAGVFARNDRLSASLLFVLLTAAAIGGNTLNYWLGRFFAPRLARDGRLGFIKQHHLARTHAFFEKYGGKTIVLSRFVPIVRTIAPFVAGLGTMSHARFQFYNVIGGAAWVGICVYSGYWFAGFDVVRENFSLVALAIVLISILPAIVEWWLHRRRAGGLS